MSITLGTPRMTPEFPLDAEDIWVRRLQVEIMEDTRASINIRAVA